MELTERQQKVIAAIKEEELLSLFIAYHKSAGILGQDIVTRWVTFKGTVTPDNIDDLILEWRLKALVRANRVAAGYSIQDVEKMIQQAIDKIK